MSFDPRLLDPRLLDPIWVAVALSALAALLAALAALAAFRPRVAVDPLLRDAVDDLGRGLETLRTVMADEARRGREEAAGGARDMRGELASSMARLGEILEGGTDRLGKRQAERLEAISGTLRSGAEATERRLGEMKAASDASGLSLREEVARLVAVLGETVREKLDSGAATQKERLDGAAEQIRRLVQTNAEANENLRRTVEGRLEVLRTENAAKLEEMRRTVDEKLQGTLEERLGEKFKIVSHHLEQVHRSVGEMQALATGVGDLKRVLINVKSRGTWAELSLGSLLDQVLTAEQFGRNVETVPGSGERVEYAVRLPGPADGSTVWLPIDAKFPIEDYERLLEAADRADAAAVEMSLRGLEARIKLEGGKIRSKYLAAPHTTDFGVLYLPTEGLYAEVLRRPGLVDHLQGQCRIIVAGPTNLHAFLTSLRMGFKTLAIEKRSSEVWETLGAVKTEFAKYGEVIDAVKLKLDRASKQLDDVATRTRAVNRKLRQVESLPEERAEEMLALGAPIDERDRLDAAE